MLAKLSFLSSVFALVQFQQRVISIRDISRTMDVLFSSGPYQTKKIDFSSGSR